MSIILSKELTRLKEILENSERGYKAAQYKLGRVYYKLKRYETAVDYFKKSVKTGFTESYFSLGECYENGYGVKKNYQTAIRYYKKAERHIITDLSTYPDPVGKQAKENFKRYCKDEEYVKYVDMLIEANIREDSFEADFEDANSGDSDAQFSLGLRYYNGDDTEQDMHEGICWIRKSADQNNESALLYLAERYEKMHDFKEAVVYYRKYAKVRIIWRNKRLGIK